MIFDDCPIKDSDSDKLGRNKFAKNIANYISNYSDSNSVAIGICGEWGSGKTSTLNLLENEIVAASKNNKSKHRNVVIKFNPWNFSNQDQLLGQFFKSLRKELGMPDWLKMVYKCGVIFGIISLFAKFISFIIPPLGILFLLFDGYSKALKSFKNNKDLEEIKNKINKKLEKQQRKFIVVIDDIDRLNDQEIVQIFQLVKLVADFKRLIYVLSYDKSVVMSVLEKAQPKFSDKYLEKIIQLPFSLPAINKKELQKILFEKINSLIGEQVLDKSRLDYLYLTGIYDSFTTLRNVKRFINNFEFNYIALKNEVDFIDFFIVRYFEFFFWELFFELNLLAEKFTGNFSNLEKDEDKSLISIVDNLLTKVKGKEQQKLAKELLRFIFPKIENLFPSPHYYVYNQHVNTLSDRYCGRIYMDDNYKRYFELVISSNDVSTEEIATMLENFDSVKFTVFINKMFKLGILEKLIRYVYWQLEKNTDIPFDKVITSFLENYYSIDNSDNTQIFEVGNQLLVLDVVEIYLCNKNDEDGIVSFINSIKDSVSLGALSRVVLTIGFKIGKYEIKQKVQNYDEEKMPLSLQEFEKMEKILSDKIFDRLQLIRDISVFSSDEFYDILLFVEKSDNDCNKFTDWIKENVKNDIPLIVKFLDLFMRRSLMRINHNTYITHEPFSGVLEKVIYPMNWDNLILDFMRDDGFTTLDTYNKRALIVYFMCKKSEKCDIDNENIDTFYSDRFLKNEEKTGNNIKEIK